MKHVSSKNKSSNLRRNTSAQRIKDAWIILQATIKISIVDQLGDSNDNVDGCTGVPILMSIGLSFYKDETLQLLQIYTTRQSFSLSAEYFNTCFHPQPPPVVRGIPRAGIIALSLY